MQGNSWKRRALQAPLIGALVGAMLVATPAVAGIDPSPFRTGLFSLTSDQTVAVSIVNIGDETGRVAPVIAIVDASGEPITIKPGAIPQPLPLAMGKGLTYLVPPTSQFGHRDELGRASIRVEVDFRGAVAVVDGRVDEGYLVDVEVVDTRTGGRIWNPAVIKGFNPQPEPPGRPLSQLLR